jgi:pimeloyl-ACP methyl ester carboxylesterase
MNPEHTVVLLPGMLNDRKLWRAVCERLDPAVDVRIPDLSPFASVTDMAGHALDITSDVTRPVALVGFSMGGIVALELLASAPERIAGVLLLDTVAHAESAGMRAVRLDLMRKVAGKFPAICEDFAVSGLAPVHQGDAALKAELLDMFHGVGPDAFLRHSEAVMNRADYLPLLRSWPMDSPQRIVIACGEHDRVCPLAWSRRMVEARPGTPLHIIADAGHMVPFEAPDKVVSLIGELLRPA